jgi:hypothetical protein
MNAFGRVSHVAKIRVVLNEWILRRQTAVAHLVKEVDYAHDEHPTISRPR